MLKSLATLGASVGLKAASSIAIFLLAGALWTPAIFGEFMYSFAIASVLVIGCEYGFTNQLLKDTQTRGASFVTSLLHAKILLAVAVICSAHIAQALLPSLQNTHFIPLFYSVLLASFFDFFSTLLRAKLAISIDFYLSTCTTALHASVAMAALFLGADPTELAFTFLATKLVAAIAACLTASRSTDFGITGWKLKSSAETIKQGFPYASDTAVNAVLNVVDGILLTLFSGNTANGIYQAAARLNQSVPIAFSVLTSFFLPRLSSGFDQKAFRATSLKFLYLTISMWLAVAALFMGALFAYRTFPINSSLYAAAPLLYGLAAVALVRFFCGWMSTLLIARDMQRKKTMAYGLALAVILISSGPLIKLYGAYGVIYAYGIGFTGCFMAMIPSALKAHTRVHAK